MAGQELSLDAIAGLLAGSRTRGDYDGVLSDFLSDDAPAGIEVDLSTGPLAGKDPKNVVTGFNNAKARMDKNTGKPVHQGGHNVKVLIRWVETDETEVVDGKTVPKKEGHVFLINTAKYNPDGATAQTAPEGEPVAA